MHEVRCWLCSSLLTLSEDLSRPGPASRVGLHRLESIILKLCASRHHLQYSIIAQSLELLDCESLSSEFSHSAMGYMSFGV